jgi:P-type Cu2+ transporter
MLTAPSAILSNTIASNAVFQPKEVIQPNGIRSAASVLRCFHCDQPIISQPTLYVRIQQQAQPVCCRGCQAVAEAISGSGFERYYAHRTAVASTADGEISDDLAAMDSPAFLDPIVYKRTDGTYQLTLSITGMRCAACMWLIEQSACRLPGVVECQVNILAQRASVPCHLNAPPMRPPNKHKKTGCCGNAWWQHSA